MDRARQTPFCLGTKKAPQDTWELVKRNKFLIFMLKTFVIREAYATPPAPRHCDCLSETILANK